MIPSKNRFHGHNAVSRVKARPVHGKLMSVRVATRQKTDAPSRVAVVVSKKIDNRAVVRNRIRRRLYEAVRTHGFVDAQAVDLVIYAKTAALATIPADDIRCEFTKLVGSPKSPQ